MRTGLRTHLKIHRTRAGLTQAELAEAVRVSRKTINTIENSVFVPSTVLALRIAAVLGVSVHDLFELEGEAVGGASDGNTTSQFTPTLDGLGGVGDGAHAPHEHTLIEPMIERTALLARLLTFPALGGVPT